jgi:hypothetical protein
VRLPVPPPRQNKMEAPPRIELGNKGFAVLCLTAWLWRLKNWSGRRDSNPRHSPWQGDALPLSHSRMYFFGAQGRNRTTDTRIFSPLLYLLSYLGSCVVSCEMWEVRKPPTSHFSFGDPEGARTLDLQRDRLAF